MDQAGYRAGARLSPGSDGSVQPDGSAVAEHAEELAPDSVRRSVTLDELEESEQDGPIQRAAENLARRAADRWLRDELAREDFSGPGYTYFAHELAAYGMAVCRAWLVTGEMFVQCQRRGYVIGSGPNRWDEHDVDGIVGETVTQALNSSGQRGCAEEGGGRMVGQA